MSASTAARRDRAVEGLLTCPTIQQAAVYAGVNEKTIRRWLKFDHDFQAAYRTARRRAFDQAIGKLACLSDLAVEELRRILENGSVATRDKLTAIRTVLEHGRATEEADITALVERLEALVEQNSRDA